MFEYERMRAFGLAPCNYKEQYVYWVILSYGLASSTQISPHTTIPKLAPF